MLYEIDEYMWQIILAGLGELPFKVTAPVVTNLIEQQRRAGEQGGTGETERSGPSPGGSDGTAS